MAKSKLGVIVALSISTFFTAPTTFANANDRLPFVKKGEVATPQVLADRIEEVLKKDPSGNTYVKGANAGPPLFLQAIQYKKPEIDTYPELVTYLRSLKSCDMPGGQMRLSEIDMVNGKPVIDLSVGTTRWAEKDEVAWCDKDGFAMAGNCMQIRLPLRITVYDPMVGEKFVDPYAGKPREVKTTSCPLDKNERYIAVHMFEPKAAKHKCAVTYMLSQYGNLGEAKEGQSTKDWSDPDAFSRECGQVIHEGGYKFSTKKHAVEIAVVNNDRTEKHVFFKGMLQGKHFTADADSEALISRNGEAVLVPKAFDTRNIVAFFPDQSTVRTPAPSGVGMRVEDLVTSTYTNAEGILQTCTAKTLTGIDMP